MKKLLLSLALVLGAASAYAADVVETITVDNFNISKETTYGDYSFTSEITGITYTAQLAKANAGNGGGMQFRTKNNSGLVALGNPNDLTVKSIKVTPSTAASTTNQWDVYGSTTAYSGPADLYKAATQGTAIGNGTSEATLTTTDGYKFIGFRANKNAIYIQTIVITYESAGQIEVKKDAEVSFGETTSFTVELGQEFTAPTLTKATPAAAKYASSNAEVATVDETTGDVTIVGAGTTTITASTEGTDEYNPGRASYTLKVVKPVVKVDVVLASSMKDGKYALVTPEGVAKNYNGTNAYGYVYLETVEIVNNEFAVNEDYLYTFASTDKGYTIVDFRGKYVGMDATHFGSFNYYDTADAEGSNCYWTVDFTADGVKISNVGREGCYISYKAYNNDWELATTDNADQPLLQLYGDKTQAGVADIVVDENAPVEFFNLQGVRVANPENGLYIRKQGNKVSKVIVK